MVKIKYSETGEEVAAYLIQPPSKARKTIYENEDLNLQSLGKGMHVCFLLVGSNIIGAVILFA